MKHVEHNSMKFPELGFKNSENVRMRATTSQLENFKLADAKVGIEFVRNMLDGYQLLKDSLIVAETPNIGKPSKIKVQMLNFKRSYIFLYSCNI